MQLVILIYHLTGASKILPIYMQIRVMVSSYLFLSGYGHFCYFFNKGDFTLHRLLTVHFQASLCVNQWQQISPLPEIISIYLFCHMNCRDAVVPASKRLGNLLVWSLALDTAYSGQRQSWKTPSELEVSKSVESDTFSLQCSDTVGWATERTSLSVLTAIFQVNPGQPVFNEAKDDGGGGDNWTTGAISRAKLCSQIIITNKPTSSFFYRPDALPVTQPTVSKH